MTRPGEKNYDLYRSKVRSHLQMIGVPFHEKPIKTTSVTLHPAFTCPYAGRTLVILIFPYITAITREEIKLMQEYTSLHIHVLPLYKSHLMGNSFKAIINQKFLK